MKTITLLTLFVLLVASVGYSGAQFTGPGAVAADVTVKSILQKPVDDQWVSVRGHITKRVGSDKYLFTDGTGEIRLDIDDKYFPTEAPITSETPIQISGKVDTEFMRSPEIDVKQIVILPASSRPVSPKGGFQGK
jgi:uncharacterized protein (TIGR00156 family)